MSTNANAIAKYTGSVANIPPEAFLGSLVFFSISAADVNLDKARREFEDKGLDTSRMKKRLRPVDAFAKSSRRINKKFGMVTKGIRSELMVRSLGGSSEQEFRQLILERVRMEDGRKRKIFFERVGELTFTKGRLVEGEYVDDGVECRRTTAHLADDLFPQESDWLDEQLATFEDHYNHLCHYMDSHAVRTMVREYIYHLRGVCVKESGGLYFVKQEHVEEVRKLAAWVRSIGSEFHDLPLVDYDDQREMILQALEEDTVQEVRKLMADAAKILQDPDRKIEEKTYEGFASRAIELASKVKEYDQMLNARAVRAELEIDIFGKQIFELATRIKSASNMQARQLITVGAP